MQHFSKSYLLHLQLDLLILIQIITKYICSEGILFSRKKLSEGPEVKIVADKIFNTLYNNITIQNILSNKIDEDIKNRIIGSSMEYVKTFGKNIVIKFSSGIYLRNHMMMWGKWRIYGREEYDNGLAKSPPSSSWRSTYWKNKNKNADETFFNKKKSIDVRHDSRVRLIIITADNVLVQFNGPILQFSLDNPADREPIKSLGPDGLGSSFDEVTVQDKIKAKSKKNTNILIADALLDQQIVSGIGNKYKSEILFLNKIYPFKKAALLSEQELNKLVLYIPKILLYGYQNKGKTRPLLNDEKTLWNTTHWVFRRSGKPCWICCDKISGEKKMTLRMTFWCPTCQQNEF